MASFTLKYSVYVKFVAQVKYTVRQDGGNCNKILPSFRGYSITKVLGTIQKAFYEVAESMKLMYIMGVGIHVCIKLTDKSLFTTCPK